MTDLWFRRTALVLSLALAAPLAACGGDDASSDAIEDTGEPGLLGRVGEMTSAMEKLQENAERPPAEPVDFRQLRDLLPETAAGLARTDAEGSKEGAMGFSISQAEATYGAAEGSDAPGSITIQVMDYGAMPAMGMMGLGWTMADIDRESGSGYEKTIQMGPNKGFRKYDTGSRSGEFSLLVAERFLVQVNGRDVEDASLEAALRAVDLSALTSMRDEGRPAG